MLHVQFFFFFVMLMFFIHAVAVTWETIRMCVSVSDDNVCVPTHCPSCLYLKASWSFLLSVPVLAVFSFTFFSNLYQQQLRGNEKETHLFDPKQAPRSISYREITTPESNKSSRNSRVQIFLALMEKKNLCPRQRRSGEGDQRHLATDISFIIKPGLTAVKV